MLSVITTGRNDDYGGNFTERAAVSIGHNLAVFTDIGFNEENLEYLLVEWMPFRNYLCTTDEFDIVNYFHPFRTIVVDRTIAKPENLNPDIYFEYFAKNAGIRRTKFNNILLINADILLPVQTAREIQTLCQNGLDPNLFYRNRYRYNGDQLVNLHDPSFSDACICGAYSGDFLLVNKDSLVNIGQGYNETDPDHRITYQTGMDGEILWNMYNAGMRLQFLENPYKHIPHGKDRTYDNYKIGQSYVNKPDWGFIKYPSAFEIDDTVEVIYN